MASDGHIPTEEKLSAEEELALQFALKEGSPPAAEASGAGEKLWISFFAVREADRQLGKLTVSTVARHAGCARGPLATVGGRFRLLREAIRREIVASRRPVDAGAIAAEVDRKADREGSLATLRKRLQVSDSLNAAYEARALEAERKEKVAATRATRFLAELNSLDRAPATYVD